MDTLLSTSRHIGDVIVSDYKIMKKFVITVQQHEKNKGLSPYRTECLRTLRAIVRKFGIISLGIITLVEMDLVFGNFKTIQWRIRHKMALKWSKTRSISTRKETLQLCNKRICKHFFK